MGTRINGLKKQDPNIDHELLKGLLGSTSGTHYHLSSSDNVLLTSGINGDTIYHNGTNFVRLSPGTSGYILETRNSGNTPIWIANTLDHEAQLTNILGSTSGFRYHMTSSDYNVATGTSSLVRMVSPSITSPTILGTAVLASGAILDVSSGTLTLGANNVIGVANGGTGVATLADGGLVVGNVAGAVEVVAAGATTEILVGGGANTNPAWGTNIPTAVTIGSAYVYRAGGTDIPITDGGTGLSVAPTQTAFLSLAGGWASGTSGDAGFTTVDTVTSGVTYKGSKFAVTTSNSYHEFAAPMPDNWNLGTVTARPYFFTSGATSNQTIVFGLQGVSLSDGDAIATSFGTAGEVTITTSSNIAGKLVMGAATSAITIGGTPAKSDWTQFRTYRKSTDTLVGDVILLGWYMSYTTSGYTTV